MDIDKPWSDFLPDTLDPILQADLNDYANLLRNLVSISSYILKWEVGRKAQDMDEYHQIIVVTSMLRRLIELLDSCDTLLRKGNIPASSSLARTIMELLAELDFLLIAKAEINHKVRCYLMANYAMEQSMLISYRTQAGYSSERTRIEGRILELETKLADNYFNPIRIEFDAMKKTDKEKWYTLATWNRTKPGATIKDPPVSIRINSIKWLIENLKVSGRKIEHMAFSLLSNYTHSSLLIQESVNYNSQGNAYIRPIGTPEDYTDFVRGLIITFVPLFEIFYARFTPHQRFKYQIVSGEFNWRYKILYHIKSRFTIKE